MNTVLITNAQVVTPDGIISDGSVWVEEGRIRQVGAVTDALAREGQLLDAGGAYVIPGIIDIHTDAMDAEIVPRPAADIPVEVAFRELERKMCSCGITTVFHSLHLGYESAENQSRSRYTRGDIFRKVYGAATRPTLIRNRIHLRFELSGINAFEECLDLMRNGVVDLLSVMDHTPGQGQFNKERFKEHLLAQGKSEAQYHEELLLRSTRPRIEGDQLEYLVRAALENRLPVASHDDDTIEKVDAMLAMGVSICEFPINFATARYASEMGMHVAGGASNILRGGSLSGNLDMTEAVLEGVVDILCSDYYPAAILHSIFKLHREKNMRLHEAVNLATLHPAESVGLDETLGSLEAGKEADLLIVRIQDGLPMATHVMVNGKFVMQTTTK
ncbi:alpha-D-ribose 1-methylphosphonate 5-triphosphate diphosphatase [Puia dinghuensis]|uniref:Alpha-D-ribose 1-methylphosphonate 5-triphosphate diphosphatase n=1 Tax=Puia dinghuensis TaxID=1792502 RepID=A0A8J2XU03_9BACT|nr:alpha-D-ribose 1-methylphosphonate 5-triphosphate diphosphatase [Puia dinghuensis]GGB07308.1 alpha-D-ribose 1-methylphosphonate 5-triphosphate diphosphatase [Puia dinghuensis]